MPCSTKCPYGLEDYKLPKRVAAPLKPAPERKELDDALIQ